MLIDIGKNIYIVYRDYEALFGPFQSSGKCTIYLRKNNSPSLKRVFSYANIDFSHLMGRSQWSLIVITIVVLVIVNIFSCTIT
jgi:hypothetical protein